MRELAIVHGAMRLGWTLIKSIVIKDTLIYRCPDCWLVVKKKAPSCIRCGTLLDWKGVN